MRDAVDWQAMGGLETLHRLLGLRTVNPVDVSWGVAHARQLVLQTAHESGAAEPVHGARVERCGRSGQRRRRVRPGDAVGGQATGRLEALDRPLSELAIQPVHWSGGKARVCELTLEVTHEAGAARVPEPGPWR
jgi:hypothetical protein